MKTTLMKVYLSVRPLQTTSEPGVCVQRLKSMLDSPMELKLYEQYKQCWMGQLSRRGIGVEQLMVYKGLADIISFDELQSVVDANEPIECLGESFDITKAEYGILTHAVNPELFYIISVHDVEKRDALQDKLKLMVSTLPELDSVKVGSICVAPSKTRNLWGRAKIIKSPDPGQILLVFIDFGFVDSIDANETVMLKTNPEDCDPFVQLCSLAVKHTNAFDDVWREEANLIIENLVEKDVFVEVLAKTPKKNYVRMFRHNRNIGDMLVRYILFITLFLNA
jgi:Tudor domain